MEEEELLVQLETEEIEQYSDFENLIGMEYEKAILRSSIPFEEVENIDLDEIMELPAVRYFLLCGPKGSGKHTLSEAYAKELQRIGFQVFWMDCAQLLEKKNPREEFRKVINEVTSIVNTGEMIYFLIENLEQFCGEKELCDDLRVSLQAWYKYGNGSAALILCAIAENVNKISQEVRRHMCVLELENPGSIDRQNYFKKKLTFHIEKFSFMPIEGISQQVFLANETEEFSYLDMEKLAMLIKLHFSQKMNQATKGDASQIAEEVQHEENYVSKETVSKMVSRIKREKAREQESQNSQNSGQTPQIIMVGGQMPMGDSYMNYMPQSGAGTKGKRKSNRDENIVDMEHFEFIADRDGDEALEYDKTENSKVEAGKKSMDLPPAFKTYEQLNV